VSLTAAAIAFVAGVAFAAAAEKEWHPVTVGVLAAIAVGVAGGGNAIQACNAPGPTGEFCNAITALSAWASARYLVFAVLIAALGCLVGYLAVRHTTT
jgi:hypothetical protein